MMLTWDQIAQLAAAGGMTAVAWVLLWAKLRDGVEITKALKAVSIALVTLQQVNIIETFTLHEDLSNDEKCRKYNELLTKVNSLLESQKTDMERIYSETK